MLRMVGVPTVDLHGPLHYLGIMDPLCGGTRATFLLLTGEATAAARYNPLVFPLAAAVLCMLVRSGVGMIAGRWLEIRLPRRWRRGAVAILIIGVAALSVRQQWNAELLMQSWPVA
ncbi:Putative membrane protein [Amycolatopsis japonica]|uniref:Putative membrane protein n=2 Tax=Amycolatopsis japonica TaxID=208439 RepID=A0A075VC35_9PSEU|nr:Putative membrane protein [Amycolatopsis japonica]